MNSVETIETVVNATSNAQPRNHLGKHLLRASWLAILLGLVMEASLIAVTLATGNLLVLEPVLADLLQKVSWSVFVCVGLAFGEAVSNADSRITGIAGMLAATTGFTVARALHKGATAALEIGVAAAGGPSPVVLALVKGAQYGCLGAIASRLERRGSKMSVYVAVGLGLGIIFGGIMLFLTSAAAPQPLPASRVLSLTVNELLFPVGCSLVLFATDVLGKRAAH